MLYANALNLLPFAHGGSSIMVRRETKQLSIGMVVQGDNGYRIRYDGHGNTEKIAIPVLKNHLFRIDFQFIYIRNINLKFDSLISNKNMQIIIKKSNFLIPRKIEEIYFSIVRFRRRLYKRSFKEEKKKLQNFRFISTSDVKWYFFLLQPMYSF